jgi:hypothetical protein
LAILLVTHDVELAARLFPDTGWLTVADLLDGQAEERTNQADET